MICNAGQPSRVRARIAINDGGGLGPHVKSTGLKYWQFRYTKSDGREGLIQIGPYSRVTLDLARAARNEHRAAVSRGDGPATLRKQDKARRTIELFARRRLGNAPRPTSKRGALSGQIRSTSSNGKIRSRRTRIRLSVHLRPADIDTDLVMRVLQPIWLTKNEMASRLRGRIESIMDWAKVSGLRVAKIQPAGAAISITC